jgi:7-carboxy-7-deazaguanine synthase
MSDKLNLRISEIFYSLQGETNTVGLPTVFVRLTGCPLRCQYCDTAYAFSGGSKMSLSEILAQVAEFNPRYVTVTGGEPLAQPTCLNLLQALCDKGYTVSLETSGAIDVSSVDPRVVKILDLKTPASGEVDKNIYANIDHLSAQDQVKFVICDAQDYAWAKDQLLQHQLTERCGVLFSPSHEQLSPRELAQWILADNLPVRMQLQIHKYIWGDERGR